jgi:ParB family chromosome partitioning protein
MSKLDELKRANGGHAAESLGVGVSRGPIPGNQGSAGPLVPSRLQRVSRAKNAMEIPVDKIAPDPDQPREEFEPESLGRLAESLKTRGQLQPIRVRWDEPAGVYRIVCGERRWRAARMAGIETLSCVVVEGPVEPAELLALQLVENCLREDLRPIEQARAFRALMDRQGLSTHQLARELSVPQSSVVKALALLDLPESVQEQVEAGRLSTGTAYEVSRVSDPNEQRAIAERVVSERLTRQEAVEAIRERAGGRAARSRTVEYAVAPGVTVLIRFRGGAQIDAAKALRLALKQDAATRGGTPAAGQDAA